MTVPVHEVLRDILRRHGTALLEDRRRCENCLREAPLARPEVNGLVAALDEGIPRRIARQPAGTLAASGIAAMAAELARNSGLAEPVARGSVEAWARALGAAPPPAPGAADTADRTATEAPADRPREAARLRAEDAPSRRKAGRPAGRTGAKPWRAAGLVAAGAAAGLVAGAAYLIVLGAIDAPSIRVWHELPPFCLGIGMQIGALAGVLAARRIAGRAGLVAGGLTAAALVLLGLWLEKDTNSLFDRHPGSAIFVLPLVGLVAVGVVGWLSRGRRRRPAETPPAPG